MVVRDEFIKRRVLFIGTAVPLETSVGLEAVQQPLRDRFPNSDESKLEGIMAYLTVTPSGLQLEYLDGSKDIILFPITSVSLCAAVRCIYVVNNSTKEKVSKFVSLSSVTAGGANASRPAIFTAITRRTVGKKILECHGFVCECDQDAFNLVQATSAADKMSKNRLNGSITTHSEMHSRSDTLKSNGNAHSDVFPMRLVSGETRSNAAPEFSDSPPQHGYFYSTKTTPIKKYTLEKVTSDNEGEKVRPTSPPPLPAGPSTDRRSAYSFATSRTGPPPSMLHTLPRQAPNVIPVRTAPVHHNIRPRFFSPPPTLLRPKVVSMLKEPYMLVSQPPPPPPSMIIDGPPHLVRSRPRRRGSESSASHSHDQGSTRSSSPASRTNPKRMMNGDGGDASSEVSSRPRTPPTDYDKKKSSKARVSRREQYEMRQPNYYPTVIRNGDVYPPQPYSPYDFYPPHSRMPVYYLERARSVPPPLERARTLEKKKGKKNRKDKKSKKRTNGVPSDISVDSIGYMSEGPPGSTHAPRDFRRFENQFKHERAFSRSLLEEKKQGTPHENQSAYALNELMANKGRNGEIEPFPMY